MSTISIACASCGAPLEVPNSVKFLTCSYCNSTLTVQSTGSAHYSELRESVQKIEKVTARAASASERVADELQLQRLKDELDEAQTSVQLARGAASSDSQRLKKQLENLEAQAARSSSDRHARIKHLKRSKRRKGIQLVLVSPLAAFCACVGLIIGGTLLFPDPASTAYSLAMLTSCLAPLLLGACLFAFGLKTWLSPVDNLPPGIDVEGRRRAIHEELEHSERTASGRIRQARDHMREVQDKIEDVRDRLD